MKESKLKPGKLTVKHQVTIPADVRKALGLKAGDHVLFEIENGRVVLQKVVREEPPEEQWYRFTMDQMTEWASPEDEEAFRDF